MSRTCQHADCNGALYVMPDDPMLPDYVQLVECDACGEVYEYDTTTGELDVRE